MNSRVLVRVEKLNRIFDRDDVIELRVINEIDDSCERGTLAASRGTGNQDDAILEFGNFTKLWRQIEFFETRRLLRNRARVVN